jgi:hypothetical protein
MSSSSNSYEADYEDGDADSNIPVTSSMHRVIEECKKMFLKSANSENTIMKLRMVFLDFGEEQTVMKVYTNV